MSHETVIEVAASTLRFGSGATGEVGPELAGQGLRRIMVVTDPNLVSLPPVQTVLESLSDAGLEAILYDRVRVEPTDRSFAEAIRFAAERCPDGFVAVGGGSSLDTCKAANLYSTWPADFLDYVYPPLGKGIAPPGPLKPMIGIPTTAGTGSETTGVAVFDFEELHVKTALSHRRLKPSLAIVDPENTRTLPKEVVAAAGLDVVSHAVESLTAIDFRLRPRAETPARRTSYQGSNPISDVWAREALRLCGLYLLRAAADAEDLEARGAMLLAAAYAGIGFGNAGVHLPHAMSYPVSGMVRDYRPPGYRVDHPLIPHGISVILCAPAVFRFTASARPESHWEAARLLGAKDGGSAADAGRALADVLLGWMDRLGVPPGLAAVGFERGDVPALVRGTRPQARITALSPRPANDDDLAAMFEDSLRYS